MPNLRKIEKPLLYTKDELRQAGYYIVSETDTHIIVDVVDGKQYGSLYRRDAHKGGRKQSRYDRSQPVPKRHRFLGEK